jgi:hypothetical protein
MSQESEPVLTAEDVMHVHWSPEKVLLPEPFLAEPLLPFDPET